jgi:uncharacterized protein
MIVHYLDASSWVKRYCVEPGTRWVAEFFARGPTIVSSALGVIEVLCTLARKHKAGEMQSRDWREKTREVNNDFLLFNRVFLTPPVLDIAADMPAQVALRGADTVHLASALYVRDSGTRPEMEVRFITSDGELAAGAKASSFRVIRPEELESRMPGEPATGLAEADDALLEELCLPRK